MVILKETDITKAEKQNSLQLITLLHRLLSFLHVCIRATFSLSHLHAQKIKFLPVNFQIMLLTVWKIYLTKPKKVVCSHTFLFILTCNTCQFLQRGVKTFIQEFHFYSVFLFYITRY